MAGKRKEEKDVLVFGPRETPEVAKMRHTVAKEYISRALRVGSIEAVNFQVRLVNDEKADKKLRFLASEAILDRYMGKAAQEIRIGETEERPIVFDDKLQILRAGFKAAEDAAVTHPEDTDAPVRAFENQVTDHYFNPDPDGVVI